MRKRVRRALALVMAAAFMMSTVSDRQLFVSAENAVSSEEVASVAEDAVHEEASEQVSEMDVPAAAVIEPAPAAQEETPVEAEPTVPAEEIPEEKPVTPVEETPAEEPAVPVEEAPAEEPSEETPAEEPVTESREEITEEPAKEPALENPQVEETTDAEKTEIKDGNVFGEDSAEETTDDTIDEEPVVKEYVVELDGVTVTASAADGVLPADAKMTVTPLNHDDGQYQEAAEALSASEVDHDGFLAFDISFWDTEGNEIEPAEGEVQVQFELSASFLPEEADVATLEVQHLAETEDGIEVQTVADTAEVTAGTVEVTETEGEAVIAAEFSVESFSTFTITWSGDRSTYFKITVHYVDENGNQITTEPTETNIPISDDDSIELASYAHAIDGYTYQYAAYDNKKVTRLKAGSGWIYAVYYRYINFYNSNEEMASLTRYPGGGEVTGDVYLVYKKDVTVTPPEVTEEKKLTRDKYVTLNEDGTYDLHLTVSGAVGSETNKAKLDVLLIVDKSGSMKQQMNSTSDGSAENKTRRIDKVADATKLLTETLSGNNNLDVQYSVVTFSGPGDWKTKGSADNASVAKDWTSNATEAYNAVAGIKPDGGTNYEAGIDKGVEQLQSARDGAQKIVIFLTDGLPTVRNGEVSCKEDDWTNIASNNNAAADAIKKMNVNAFYCIGAGPGFSNENSTAVNNLKALCEAVNAATTKVYPVTETSELNNAFKEIAAESTTILCENVTITDTLSENVQMVMESNQPKKLIVTVTNGDGKEVVPPATSVTLPATDKNEAATISANYADGKIVLNFPDDYQLEANWTYKVTATIDATEEAYVNYRENGNSYPDTGDTGTGDTSAGKAGVYTNEGATVTYTFKGEEKSETYPMPVIQLHPGTLKIEKVIEGLDNDPDAFAALMSQLSFQVSLNDVNQSVSVGSFKPDSESGKLTYSITGLSPNTRYRIVEENASIEGYDWTKAEVNKEGTIAKDGVATATFTNTYVKSTGSLTITKEVEGIEKEIVPVEAFTFEVKDSTGTAIATVNLPTSEDVWSTTIDDLLPGEYTVEETEMAAVDGYTLVKVNDKVSNDTDYGKMTATVVAKTTASVTCVNTYESLHSLKVVKNVTGNMGDKAKAFTFKISVNDTTGGSVDVDGSYDGIVISEGQFTLTHGQSITIPDLRESYTYTVEEVKADNKDYETTVQKTVGSSKIDVDNPADGDLKADNTLTFTNEKQIDPPTGIVRDSAPYLLMMLVSLGCIALFIIRRRRV